MKAKKKIKDRRSGFTPRVASHHAQDGLTPAQDNMISIRDK